MSAKAKDLEHLPDWPRMLSRDQAAAYCSLSPNAFDDHIRTLMDEIHLGRSVRFDRLKLDKIIDSLQADHENTNPMTALAAL